jgi:hypothetical protein
MCLNNDKTGYAWINKSTEQDYPEETDLGRNKDEHYIGGGLTRDISVLEFELYALFFD